MGRDELLAERCHCGADVAPRIQPYPESGIEQLTYRCTTCTCAWQRTVPASDDPETAVMQERADDAGPRPGQAVRVVPASTAWTDPPSKTRTGVVVGRAWSAGDLVTVNIGRAASSSTNTFEHGFRAEHMDHLNMRDGTEGTWECLPPGAAPLESTLELSPAVARAIWSALEEHFTGEVGS